MRKSPIYGTPAATWRLWIGAFALFVQLLLPVQHVLARSGGADERIVLCTAEGSVVLSVAGFGDQEAPKKAVAGIACPLCAIGGTQVLLAPGASAGPAIPFVSRPVEFCVPATKPARSGSAAAYGSRAPPVST